MCAAPSWIAGWLRRATRGGDPEGSEGIYTWDDKGRIRRTAMRPKRDCSPWCGGRCYGCYCVRGPKLDRVRSCPPSCSRSGTIDFQEYVMGFAGMARVLTDKKAKSLIGLSTGTNIVRSAPGC